MAQHEDSIKSSTTSTATTSPPPPLPSSSSSPPSSHRAYSGTAASFHGLQGEVSDFRSSSGHLQPSPMCNGYGTSSPHHSNEETDVQSSEDASLGEGGRETRSNPSSNPLPPSLDTGVKNGGLQQVPMVVKQERDQDGPLDFSVRRRDSVSESFTDDSRASSSISPPSYSGVGVGGALPYSSSTSLQHSPEGEPLHLAAAPAAPPPLLQQRPPHHHHHHHHKRHHSGSSHGADGADPFHKLPQPGRSPGSSPDGDLIAHPKALSRLPVGKMGSRSPVNSSLAALGMMAEGGAGGMTPAALAAMTGQNGGLMGHLGNLSPFMAGEFRKMAGTNGGKVQRPFKAYPKEALQMPLGYLGLPGINPFPGLDYNSLQGLSLNQEEVMSLYKQQLDFMKEREKQMMSMNKTSSRSPPSSTSSSSTSTSSSFGTSTNGSSNSMIPPTPPPPLPPPPPLTQPSLGHSHPVHPSLSSVSAAAAAASSFFPPSSHSSSASSLPPHSNNNNSNNNSNNTSSGYSHIPSSSSSSSSPHFPTPTVPPLVSSTSSITGGGSRKRPRSLPDEQKDEAYWERRRKNNDAAKRSRDARRAKEDEIALRAALLEQENLKLRVEVAALKTETARLRCMLYNS